MFLLKHKRTIIFWIVFLAIILVFVPTQDNYYLDNDIRAFKQTYLTPILLWTGIVASIGVNRQFARGSLQRTYVANYWMGADQTKDHFYPLDISTHNFATDKKLINKIYKPGLKQNDTVLLIFNKGLFGIAFPGKPLIDK